MRRPPCRPRSTRIAARGYLRFSGIPCGLAFASSPCLSAVPLVLSARGGLPVRSESDSFGSAEIGPVAERVFSLQVGGHGSGLSGIPAATLIGYLPCPFRLIAGVRVPLPITRVRGFFGTRWVLPAEPRSIRPLVPSAAIFRPA